MRLSASIGRGRARSSPLNKTLHRTSASAGRWPNVFFISSLIAFLGVIVRATLTEKILRSSPRIVAGVFACVYAPLCVSPPSLDQYPCDADKIACLAETE